MAYGRTSPRTDDGGPPGCVDLRQTKSQGVAGRRGARFRHCHLNSVETRLLDLPSPSPTWTHSTNLCCCSLDTIATWVRHLEIRHKNAMFCWNLRTTKLRHFPLLSHLQCPTAPTAPAAQRNPFAGDPRLPGKTCTWGYGAPDCTGCRGSIHTWLYL